MEEIVGRAVLLKDHDHVRDLRGERGCFRGRAFGFSNRGLRQQGCCEQCPGQNQQQLRFGCEFRIDPP